MRRGGEVRKSGMAGLCSAQAGTEMGELTSLMRSILTAVVIGLEVVIERP